MFAKTKTMCAALALAVFLSPAIGDEAVTTENSTPLGQILTPDDVIATPLILAGDPNGTPPDSPGFHVDPNVASSPFAGVGSVVGWFSPTSGILGSGTLISRRHVLTAGHMLDYNNDGIIDFQPTDMSFFINDGPTPLELQVSFVRLHPDFTGFNNPALNDDLAILTLASEAPASVPDYPLWRSALGGGQVTLQVGYGASGDGLTGETIQATIDIKRIGANAFDDAFEDDEQSAGNGLMEVWMADFDNPDGSAGFLGGSTLGNDIETNLGHGDSGGPSFVTSGGEYYLAGTNTLGFRTATGPSFPFFGSGMGGMLVYPYLDWMDSIMPLLGVPGDADLNLMVELSDLTILASNFNQSSMGWSDGDFNGSGSVSLADLTILATYFGYDGTAGSFTIPEPSALALLTVGAVSLAGRRSLRRRLS